MATWQRMMIGRAELWEVISAVNVIRPFRSHIWDFMGRSYVQRWPRGRHVAAPVGGPRGLHRKQRGGGAAQLEEAKGRGLAGSSQAGGLERWHLSLRQAMWRHAP